MGALMQLSNGNRERVMRHIEALPELADEIEAGAAAAEPHLAREAAFLAGSLVPLMDAVESLVYPELDRLLSCRLAMTPMEREHAEARRLIARIGDLASAPRSEASVSELGRALRRLYTLIASHLADESSYARLLEHNVDAPIAEALASAMPPVSTAI